MTTLHLVGCGATSPLGTCTCGSASTRTEAEVRAARAKARLEEIRRTGEWRVGEVLELKHEADARPCDSEAP